MSLMEPPLLFTSPPGPRESVRGEASIGGLGSEGGITEGLVVRFPYIPSSVHGGLYPVIVLVEVGGSIVRLPVERLVGVLEHPVQSLAAALSEPLPHI